MPKILILADDLTGANDTGASIHEVGFETYTVVNVNNYNDNLKDFSCISVNLESRNIEARAAAEIVQRAASRFATLETKLYSKRIDSTLRGNLGSECDALLDQLDPATVAIVVPAFPKAGRVYRDERVFVYGVPLVETAAAHDPKWPMQTSSLKEVLQQQTSRPMQHFSLEQIHQGPQSIQSSTKQAIAEGYKYLLFDAETDADIEAIAQAVVATKHPFVAVDPGPFTAAVAQKLIPCHAHKREVLAVVGSVNAVTKEQIKQLITQKQVPVSQLDIETLLLDEESRIKEIDRAAAELANKEAIDGVRLLLLSSVIGNSNISFESYAKSQSITEEMVSKQINDALSSAACKVLAHCQNIGGLFTCGGDVTVAMCSAMGADGMRVLNEVIPLAVCGELIGADRKKYFIITKGGMVGDQQGIIDCIDHLSEKLYTKERF